MVASTHWLASAVGMSILERGGNAFDAAVAAGFTLQVVEPHLNGPGGEVPIIFYSTERKRVQVVNGQGFAPQAATIEHFKGLGLDEIPGDGLLPACVPGAFGGWMLLLEELGTMHLADVLEPALGYAKNGWPVLGGIATAIGSVEELFAGEWRESATTWLDGAHAPRRGARWRSPGMASTYERVIAEAKSGGGGRAKEIKRAVDVWYRGFVAEAIDAYFASAEVMDRTGSRHGGLLTGDDLASWAAALEDPVEFDYHGFTVCKTPPWGQGPVFLQQLALLEGFDLGAMGLGSADYVHTVVECAKLAFADREAWYGDPGFTDVPLDELLSGPYADARRACIGDTASLELRPGEPGGRAPRLAALAATAMLDPQSDRGGDPTLSVSGGDTCHVDVVDRFGNMVSATPSGGWLMSSPVVPGLGFPLGTRAQMFWLEDGVASSLAPGKRPRTTLSPSLATRGGAPYMAFGTPGGDQQDQWTLAFWLAHVHFGLNLQEAIDAVMFHSTHMPSSFNPRTASPGGLAIEGRADPEVVNELAARGHRVEVEGDWSLGRVTAVARDPDAGWLRAGANPRGMQGYAAGR